MIKAQNMIRSMFPACARNNAATKMSAAAKVIYRIHPSRYRGCFGTLYGRKSSTMAVQQAYPHHPRPKISGPNIFATA